MSPLTRGLLTIALVGVMGAGIWAFNSSLLNLPVEDQAANANDTSTASWPTVPPTIAPATAAPLPMPTLIPIPHWEEKRELEVIEFTLFSYQEAPVEKFPHMPGATVLLRTVYALELSVNLTQISPSDVIRHGNVITVTMPHPTLAHLPRNINITPASPQHHLEEYFNGGPPAQVIAKGATEVTAQFRESDGLQHLADEAAIRQMQAFLQTFGFHQVNILFKD